jgi:hypothetical protein
MSPIIPAAKPNDKRLPVKSRRNHLGHKSRPLAEVSSISRLPEL